MTIAGLIIVGIICLAGAICTVFHLGEIEGICNYGYVGEDEDE